jgi:hypothetical protein
MNLLKLQRALREMLVIGLILGTIFFLTGRNVQDAAGAVSCGLTGLLFSPLGWAAYRGARFIIVPRRNQGT